MPFLIYEYLHSIVNNDTFWKMFLHDCFDGVPVIMRRAFFWKNDQTSENILRSIIQFNCSVMMNHTIPTNSCWKHCSQDFKRANTGEALWGVPKFCENVDLQKWNRRHVVAVGKGNAVLSWGLIPGRFLKPKTGTRVNRPPPYPTLMSTPFQFKYSGMNLNWIHVEKGLMRI